MKFFANDAVGKLVLRLVLGAVVLLHGIAKLRGGVGFIEGVLTSHGLPAFLAYGAYVGEVLAPLLLIVGFYARVGALLVAVNMVFAIVLVHMGELARLNEQGGWAIELQAMLLFGALAAMFLGPGRPAINDK
jgi:putative oxidoreductase